MAACFHGHMSKMRASIEKLMHIKHHTILAGISRFLAGRGSRKQEALPDYRNAAARGGAAWPVLAASAAGR